MFYRQQYKPGVAAPEKPSTKIVVGVAVAAIVGVVGFLAQRSLVPAFDWSMRLLGKVWHWLFSTHAVYGWLLSLLSLGGVWCFFRIFAAFSHKATIHDKPQPHWSDFTEFEFEGVRWRWQYDRRDQIANLFSFCSVVGCDMQTFGQLTTYHGPGREITTYRCHRCGDSRELSGHNDDIQKRIMLEIDRLHRTGEWKQYIKHLND